MSEFGHGFEEGMEFVEGMEALEKLKAAIVATGEGDLPEEEKAEFVEIIGQETAADVFGECDGGTYCKFYGRNFTFCDMLCEESVWDQA